MLGRNPIALSILGRSFLATGASPALARWLRFQWQRSDTGLNPVAFHIELEAHDGARRVRSRDRRDAIQQRTTVAHDTTTVWQRRGDSTWNTRDADGGEVSLDLTDSHALIRVWGGHHGHVRRRLLHVVYVAVCEALRASGLVPLHAAAVVRNDCAVLLSGRSGVGKSSTLIAAVDGGWTPLAEDLVWFESSTKRIYAWDHGVRLTPDGVRRLTNAWQSKDWVPGADGKLWLNLDSPLTRHARLVRILVLHRDPTRDSGAEPLQTREVVRALWEAGGVPLDTVNREQFSSQIPRLLSTIPVARYVLGRTPIEF